MIFLSQQNEEGEKAKPIGREGLNRFTKLLESQETRWGGSTGL